MSYRKGRSYKYKRYSGYYPSRRRYSSSISFKILVSALRGTLATLVSIDKALREKNMVLAKAFLENKIYELENLLESISYRSAKGEKKEVESNAESNSNNK